MKSLSFIRRYANYTGGHQKVADYIGHAVAEQSTQVCLYLDNRSALEPELFDNLLGVDYQRSYLPEQADAVFLAGMDWRDYLPFYSERQPKLNLIQHVRHGDKNHPLFAFLKYRAIRLCVSEAVRNAIMPYANGPCVVIKMGHQIARINTQRDNDIYILGNKQPELARRVAKWAKSKQLRVLLHDEYVAKADVLLGMASSYVALTLPNKTEGFYLPGIEAMALSKWAVVPNCVANAEYVHRFANITPCQLNFASCISAVDFALTSVRSSFSWGQRAIGHRVVSRYSLQAERRQFHTILKDLDIHW